ncbi:hypothetical protein HD806DRAFT_145002 [Xylariaceae sp. AK1471]|nr:hypothetical protein HD806DRAFT_145002 [Xylariaceae sp. AK1471]
MQDFEKSCDIRCDVQGIRFAYPKVVYSTDPQACPTFLHMHDDNGSCMPDTISTSSLIIKHHVPVTNKWEYFYLTANLCPITAHGTDDARSWRPMRLGRCVPVGMKVAYPQNFDFLSDIEGHIELVHVHKLKNESQEAFDQRMSTVSSAEVPTPILLSDLKPQLESVEETKKTWQQWKKTRNQEKAGKTMPPVAIRRHQEAPYMPMEYRLRCYDGIWSLDMSTNVCAQGAVKLTGSDIGCLLVRYNSQGSGITDGNTPLELSVQLISKIVGIVELISLDDKEKWHVVVRHMSAVVPDLERRFEALFPTPKEKVVVSRGRGR